jgi:pantetheine-phosphate adenylyltransferase
MDRIAIFPGSFDPITKGHENIILRASQLFDKIIVAVGNNSDKNSFFTLEQRVEFIKQTFVTKSSIEVDTYDGLTVEYCKRMNARFILRGLRSSLDFEYEKSISQLNRSLAGDIDTIFLITSPEFAAISSTIVRDILANKGDVTPFIPDNVSL